MRILTWNINGIRTLPQYYPWCTFKDTFKAILDHLQADIVCFQETKTSRSALSKDVAVPDSYHSFFSFPVRKTGYSGVAIYTRVDSVVPIKAEEGLSGLLQPKPPLSDSEHVSNRDLYPTSLEEGLDTHLNFSELDSEGRALTIDFGLFVLINVYCPNDGTGTEERDKFKMDYHRMLESRVKGLLAEGREVIVLGDINACAAVIDHCEGPLMVARGQATGLKDEEGFWEKDFRRWLRDWLVHEDSEGTMRGGPMVDIVRRFWPDRKGMYTCWNTKLSARESNYGTRIDYILITRGLVPWIKAADVQQDIKGSDHCPVFVDLHDEITTSDGSVIRLRDVLGARSPDDAPPRLATRFWDEYSGKQMQLHKFFTKKTAESSKAGSHLPTPDGSSSPPVSLDDTPQAASQTSSQSQPSIVDRLSQATLDSHTDTTALTPIVSQSSPITATSKATNIAPGYTPDRPQKRKLVLETPLEKLKKQKGKKVQKNESSGSASQSKLSSFFPKPKAVAEPSPGGTKGKEKDSAPPSMDIIDVDDCPTDVTLIKDNIPDTEIEECPYPSSQSFSSQCSTLSTPSDNGTQSKSNDSTNRNGNGKNAWSAILAPTPIPRCAVHDEPAKEYTVNKPGPNRGKQFFICSRPVGPGYDKGRAERLREQVDPQYRCNYFKWSSDVRKESRRQADIS